MVEASLNGLLDVHPFAALPAYERFDDSEAAKDVSGPAMRTAGAAHFHRRQLHQPRGGLVDGNGIDHRTTRVAKEVGHIATFPDHKATVAVRAGCNFVRDDQVAAFVLGHIA